MPSPVLLSASGLRLRHRTRSTPLSPRRVTTALDGVALTLAEGERLGVVGASGSGKSTLVRVLLALERPDAGQVRFGPEQRPVRAGSARRTRWFRSQVQFVPQDPAGSFNPRLRVGESIAEPLSCLGIGGDHRARVGQVLEAVGLQASMADRHPHEFSGGQRQRLAVARALAPGPRVLIADEPVSALDVSSQARIIELLNRLSGEHGLALLLVSHELGVVRRLCERVMVMHQGRVVEQGETARVLDRPEDPCTQRLVEAVPRLPALEAEENDPRTRPAGAGARTADRAPVR
ncbi:ABC transporter ATP-binding protein [Nocardiopsis salina]|uniref:ABC transporter ATP-binding protein n=1 Tax=Nocardiopsis salina TaxID=245836 RepID=UPI00034906A2|nr:ABC transporter ATP-binding protein [Nocardiopsis salina]